MRGHIPSEIPAFGWELNFQGGAWVVEMGDDDHRTFEAHLEDTTNDATLTTDPEKF